MIYLPKFSVGSIVRIDYLNKTGEIVGIDANLKVNVANDHHYKVSYMIRVEDAVKRISEEHLLYEDHIETINRRDELDQVMNAFRIDGLLLARKFDPERVDNILRELLN